MVVPFTADISLVGRGKRLYSWHLSQGTGAQTVNFRRGSVSGEIVFQVQVPATTSASQSYNEPLYCTEGWFVDVVGTGLAVGLVDIG